MEQRIFAAMVFVFIVGFDAGAMPPMAFGAASNPIPEPPRVPGGREALKAIAAQNPISQGFSPFAIALTKDGRYGYISFDLSETIFKIRLDNMAIEASADLKDYFPLESENVALDAKEEKLFVSNPSWSKILVLDTRTMGLMHVIDGIDVRGMVLSQYGPVLITWQGNNTVRLINTDTYEITVFVENNIGFQGIRESNQSEDEWYVVTQLPRGQWEWVTGIYNRKTKSWVRQVSFPLLAERENLFDMLVQPGAQKIYLATFGGWYSMDFRGYGWVHSIDLAGGKVDSLPVDGGALSLETSPDGRRLYVGTGWPVPNTTNILVVDTLSQSVMRPIALGQNAFRWPQTQINDLQLDPSSTRWLYATSTDGNSLTKVDVDTLSPSATRVFNEESLRPRFFAGLPRQGTGYVLASSRPSAFLLDLQRAEVLKTIEFPRLRDDSYSFDVGFDGTGRLLIAQGESVLELKPKSPPLVDNRRDLLNLPPVRNYNPSDVERHILSDLPPVWHFVLSNDGSRLLTVAEDRAANTYRPNILLSIDTANFQAEASVKLEGGSFNERPFELPGGSKLYALGGEPGGAVVIHVIGTNGFRIQKTITFNEPGFQGISGGPYYPFAYDAGSRTLFVGATEVVLAINTDTDAIIKVIRLADVANTLGLEPGRGLTYINAIGMFFNPSENYLYIAHLDRSFISIFDLSNGRFLPRVISLQGFFPNFVFASDDGSKLYTLNIRSDSVSVIDLKLKKVEKVIDLHAYLPEK